MSKKLYLLCALLVVAVALTVAPAFAVTQTVKTFDMNTNPGWTLTGDWAFGLPQGLGGDPDTHAGRDPNSTESAGNVLGTNLAGNYASGADETATSGDIDLTGKVGTKLTFNAWLEVQDSLHDQATVEVSNDGGGTWNVVWENTPDTNTLDPTTTVGGVSRVVDISSVADGQTIDVRFHLVSDGSIEYGGWNLKKVIVTCEADANVNFWLMSTTDDLSSAWTLDSGWTVGAPAVGTSGEPPGGADAMGVDPATDSTGVTGSLNPILGYNIGGNYERSMLQKYATSPDMGFSSDRSVKLSFQRWLAVEDGRYDHAALQINNDDLDSTNEILDEDFSGGIGSWASGGTGAVDASSGELDITGNEAASLAVDTSQFYNLSVKAKLGFTPASGSTGNVRLQYSNDGTTWVTIATVSAKQSLTSTGALPLPAPSASENNPNFQIRVILTGLATDAAAADDIVITGVKWVDLYTNPVGPNADGSKADVFDTEWSLQTFDLTDYADGNSDVRIRFVMGPTDDFVPTPPQLGTEYGGWSVENIQLTTGTSEWLPVSDSVPTGMVWETGGTATFTVKNYGTGYWDDTFGLFLVDAATPTAVETERWAAGGSEADVSGTVASGATNEFDFDITAPPLTSMAYAVPPPASGDLGDPTDPKKSNLDINATLEQNGPANPDAAVPLYDNIDSVNATGTGVPTEKIVTDRFPDILPGTDGVWARYWIEELAGRVPFVVQGFIEPDGSATYRPLVEIDRASMAVYIQRAMEIDISNATFLGMFRDVDKNTFGALSIEALAQTINPANGEQVISGYPPDFTTFQPTTSVTRDQMAKFIANGSGLATPFPPANASFDDVPFYLPGTSTPNPFAKYIYACAGANIVQGYQDVTTPNGVTYRPSIVVSRDQLAVFVWRAFMEPTGAAVILGGPAVTAIDPSDSATTTVGWQSAAEADAWTDSSFMYGTFDALLLNNSLLTPSGAEQVFQVKFELRGPSDVTAPASRTFITDMVQPLGGAPAVKLNAAALPAVQLAAATSGVPYLTFFEAIPQDSPTPPATTPYHGDFTLVVSVATPSSTSSTGSAWTAANRQPEFKSYGRFLFNNFDNGDLSAWTLTGTPAKPITVLATGIGIGKPGELNGQVVKFVETGQMKQGFNTTGWSDMILTAKIIPAFLDTSDTFTIEYSTDGGTTWQTGYSISDVPAPATADLLKVLATKISFDLPADANDNPNFMLRITLNGATVNAIVYLDDLQIKGL